MALQTRKAGRVPAAAAPLHHAYSLATEWTVWVSVLTLMVLIFAAFCMLYMRVTGF